MYRFKSSRPFFVAIIGMGNGLVIRSFSVINIATESLECLTTVMTTTISLLIQKRNPIIGLLGILMIKKKYDNRLRVVHHQQDIPTKIWQMN